VEFADFDPDKVGSGKKGVTQVTLDFVGRMERALESSVGSSVICRKSTRRWYDKEVKQSVKERREAYMALRSNSSDASWEKYKLARKNSHKIINDKKAEEWKKFLESIDEAQNSDLKRFWNLVHRFMPKGAKVSAQPIQRQDGSLAVSEEQICNAWADHQEKLFTPRPDPSFCQKFAKDVTREVTTDLPERSLYEIDEPDSKLDGEFTLGEIKRTVESRKFGKGAGLDKTDWEPRAEPLNGDDQDLVCPLFEKILAHKSTKLGYCQLEEEREIRFPEQEQEDTEAASSVGRPRARRSQPAAPAPASALAPAAAAENEAKARSGKKYVV